MLFTLFVQTLFFKSVSFSLNGAKEQILYRSCQNLDNDFRPCPSMEALQPYLDKVCFRCSILFLVGCLCGFVPTHP